MVKKTFRFQGKTRDDYLRLIQQFPLISISSDEELQAAQEIMDRLLAQEVLSKGEELYLDALSDLVASYEDEHFPLPRASDAEMLRHLMEAKSVSQIELHRETKIAKSTISEILAGKRPFSRQIIGILSGYFGVDKSVLTQNI